jgi:ribonuclease HI
MDVTIHTDGASRGNPGPAAWAYVITQDGKPAVEAKARLGITTNNQAEYQGLIHGLERAAQIGAETVTVFSDSELLVKQMNGQYRVKNLDLQPLFDEAKRLARQFSRISIRHVRREQNRRADEMCNAALDEADCGDGQPLSRSSGPALSETSESARLVRTEVLAILQEAADSWARGEETRPSPEQIWRSLEAILRSHGLLKLRIAEEE